METRHRPTARTAGAAAPPGDAELVEACRRGDQRAWERLILRYRRLIYSQPSTVFGMSPDDADEVFQVVVVKLYRGLDRLRDAGSLPSWLVSVARHECLRIVRRRGRSRSLEADPEPLGWLSPRQLRDLHAVDCEHALARAFERLDHGSRTLLTALFVEEPTPGYAEIARRLRRPVGSLGPSRARALAKLRALYLEEGGPVPALDDVDPAGLRRAS